MSDRRVRTGRTGERLAEKYLKRRGFRTVEKNLRSRAGEIDLLMWDDETLVIVEVRTVTDAHGMDASDRVPVSKRRQLVRLARQLLAELESPIPDIRFDVCVVTLEPKPQVQHIPEAFYSDDFPSNS